MTKYDLRDYYILMESKVTLQMAGLPEGLQKQSAEECLEYFLRQRMHYTAACNESER